MIFFLFFSSLSNSWNVSVDYWVCCADRSEHHFIGPHVSKKICLVTKDHMSVNNILVKSWNTYWLIDYVCGVYEVNRRLHWVWILCPSSASKACPVNPYWGQRFQSVGCTKGNGEYQSVNNKLNHVVRQNMTFPVPFQLRNNTFCIKCKLDDMLL